MVVDASVDDLIVSAAVTGAPASWLKSSLRSAGLDPEALPAKPDLSYDAANGGAKRWRDIWAAGQGVGASRAIEPVAVIVDQVDAEYRDALAEAGARAGPFARVSA
jgi:nitronate monooxygenase